MYEKPDFRDTLTKILAILLIVIGVGKIAFSSLDIDIPFNWDNNFSWKDLFSEKDAPAEEDDLVEQDPEIIVYPEDTRELTWHGYPEAEYSNTASIDNEIVEYAYQNESISYIILDESAAGDCSVLSVRARTEADNVRDPESTMMVYDRDFWTNFFTMDSFDFSTGTSADGAYASVEFNLRNTSDGIINGLVMYAEFYDRDGYYIGLGYGSYFSDIQHGEKINMAVTYELENGDNTPESFMLSGVKYTYIRNGKSSSHHWTFD